MWESIYKLDDSMTYSISAENPTGEKGKGALALPSPGDPAFKLGKGWKVRPCIDLENGKEITIADIKGPGIVNYIWLAVDVKAYRTCILRMYWDEEKEPSVEVPLGDFFVNAHGLRFNVNSIPIVVNPSGGFNSYWQMPFRKRAKITIENQSSKIIEEFFYQITFTKCDVPENIGYFHAQWRRSMARRENPEHVILDKVSGSGKYVGTVLAWSQLSDGWWGEGEVKFYIDDDENPSICYTGIEDYFGGAWCFGETYSTPFLGYPLWKKEPGKVPKHVMYRWHILDPIRFEKNIKVTVQALGWWPNGTFQPLTDDIVSVAYWYQNEPHFPFPKLPPLEERWPR